MSIPYRASGLGPEHKAAKLRQKRILSTFLVALGAIVGTGVVAIARGCGSSGWVALGSLVAFALAMGWLAIAMGRAERLTPSLASDPVWQQELRTQQRTLEREWDVFMRVSGYLVLGLVLVVLVLVLGTVGPDLRRAGGMRRWGFVGVVAGFAIRLADIAIRRARSDSAGERGPRVAVSSDSAADAAAQGLLALGEAGEAHDAVHAADVSCEHDVTCGHH